jgi:hypothetical protein
MMVISLVLGYRIGRQVFLFGNFDRVVPELLDVDGGAHRLSRKNELSGIGLFPVQQLEFAHIKPNLHSTEN